MKNKHKTVHHEAGKMQVEHTMSSEASIKSGQVHGKAHDELEERVRERTSELERSNRLLIKEILEHRYAESRLKLSLTEKDVLLKEIHHRVKNNLQIVSSLLNLQSRQLNDEKAISSFEASKNRIHTIATLHEQLYRSKDLSRIDFRAYLQNMTSSLLSSYAAANDSIMIKINSEPIFLDINKAIPCGLIVNELVSNAIKHGFRTSNQGEIVVDFSTDGDRYVLSVSNTGEQFPEDLDIDGDTSLGLKLVTSLAKQLKGSLALSRGEVTKFTLDFRC